MQDIKALRVFLKVAELTSFAAAARALGMTPASVTRIVARLEADLGNQLFVRTTRQVALTSVGALVAARYRPIVDDFDQVTQEITRASRPDQGRLSINAPLSLGLRLLPDLCNGFRLAYPNIALDLRLTDTLVDILDDPCDLAIRISGPPSDKSTIWRKICEVPRHAVAAPGLFERMARPTQPEGLDPGVCMSYSARGTPEVWTFRQGALRRTVTAGSSILSNNGDFLYEMAVHGNGIAVLPGFIVAGGLSRGDIEPVLPEWSIAPLWLTLFYPPYEALPPLVATFSDFFEAYLRDVSALDFRET